MGKTTKGFKSVKKQIFYGYIIIILIMVLLVGFSVVCLSVIGSDHKIVAENREHQSNAQEAVGAHYAWLDGLSISIQTGATSTDNLDTSQCELGKWILSGSEQTLNDPNIKDAIEDLKKNHDSIHNSAKELLDLNQTDSKAAFTLYINDIKPQTANVFSDLKKITAYYEEMANKASNQLEYMITFSLIAGIICALTSILFAYRFANSISRKISIPIATVASWSEKLSMGKDDLDFNMIDLEENTNNEIGVMLNSFLNMAVSIRENVNVVRRVAEGDMTAFVNIRSKGDSLGKNLYKMIQSNDFLYANILKIAGDVADESEAVSRASQTLAQSNHVQADSVHGLSVTIDYVAKLINNNTEKTKDAANISNLIMLDAKQSDENLDHLFNSVGEIRDASGKISTIIKSIDDIAFQTNILALNAAVEAARAGEAGKGFAVVANEVRELALKSAKAVTESRQMIEDMVSKTNEGNRISMESANMFKKIISKIGEIAIRINDISTASDEQLTGISKVREEIEQISSTSQNNASISQESAASSEQMKKNADVLKQAMGKFNLRKRQMGKAYIPPEKRNDKEFIERANANYRKAIETGHYGFELEEH